MKFDLCNWVKFNSFIFNSVEEVEIKEIKNSKDTLAILFEYSRKIFHNEKMQIMRL